MLGVTVPPAAGRGGDQLDHLGGAGRELLGVTAAGVDDLLPLAELHVGEVERRDPLGQRRVVAGRSRARRRSVAVRGAASGGCAAPSARAPARARSRAQHGAARRRSPADFGGDGALSPTDSSAALVRQLIG